MRNIKKIMLLLSVVILCLCACRNVDKTEDIYILTGSNGNDMNRESFKQFSREPSDYGIYTGMTEYKDNQVDRTRNIMFEDKGEFTYQVTRAKYKNSDEQSHGEFYSVYDIYIKRDEEGNYLELVEFVRDTGFMSTYSAGNRVEDGIYRGTGNQKDIVEKFLKELLTEEEFSKYTYIETITHKYSDDVTYRYVRLIEGYCSEDAIVVSIRQDGVIEGYSASAHGKFDSLIDNLTKEKLDATRERLETKIAEAFDDEEIELGEPYIIANTSGELFMEMPIIEKTCAYTMIAPIE